MTIHGGNRGPGHMSRVSGRFRVAGIALTNFPVQNVATSFTPTTRGGKAPITFAITTGTLPTGLTLHTDTGVIDGTPSALQTKTGLVLTATDANSKTAAITFDMQVIPTLDNLLVFSGNEIGLSAVEDAELFTVAVLTAASTRTLIPDTGQVKINASGNIARGASGVSADEVISGVYREAYAHANPAFVDTPFSFTVVDDLTAPVTLAANGNVLSTLSVDLLTSKSTGTYTSQKAGCHRSTNFIATGTKAAVEVNPASWSNIRRIGFGTALFDVRVDTTEDRLGSTSTAAGVFGNNGGSAQFRLNGVDTQVALSSTPGTPASFGAITSATWTRLEVDNNTGGAPVLRIIKSDGTTISAPLTLPTGDMFLIIEHDTSNSPGADVTVNFGDNASGTFTDAQGKKWFVNPGARGYLAIPGTSGGGGASVDAANASELVTRLGTIASGGTINLTTAGANYGSITLTGQSFAANVTVQYTGGGTRPIVEFIDINGSDHFTFRGFEVKRSTSSGTGQNLRCRNAAHHITFDDLVITGTNVRNAGTGAITFNGVAISGGGGGIPINGAGLFDVLSASHDITIKNCVTEKCFTAINVTGGSYNVVIQDNAWSNHYGDGIDIQGADGSGNSTHHVTVVGNTMTDFFAVPGDHQDGAQCNTLGLTNPIHHITFLNNLFQRGSGYAYQIIFMGSEQERNAPTDPAWYEDILISGNTGEGGLQNGIIIGCGDRVELSSNICRGYAAANPDPGQPIVLVSGMSIADCSNVTYTGNQSQSWSSGGFNAGTAAPPNTTTTYVTTASGNSTVGAI